jgi:hypothetical protein
MQKPLEKKETFEAARKVFKHFEKLLKFKK